MKNYAARIALLICLTIPTIFARKQEVFAQSFMFTRPAYYSLAMNQALWHDIIYQKKGDTRASFQAIGFYQKSVKQGKTARYFLPDCVNKGCEKKNEVIVAGDSIADMLFTRDMRAEWIDLPNDFEGKFTICPEQNQYGVAIEYHQDLGRFTDIRFLKDWWFSLYVPIVRVENNLNFSQITTSTGQINNCPDTIIAALSQPDWKYSKFWCKQKSDTNVGVLRLTLGSTYMSENNNQLAYYSFVGIPTASEQNPEFIFDPFVGSNHHLTYGVGINIQFLLNKNTDLSRICFFINLENIFHIRNFQKRTYDLKDKPYSRFLQFKKENGSPTETFSGVNILTLESKVRTYDVVDFSTGWRIKTDKAEFELSYNVWGHGDEKLTLRCPLLALHKCERYGIAGTGSMLVKGQSVATSANKSTISCLADNDLDSNNNPEFIPIKESDIDLKSGAATSALNHKVQLVAGIVHKGKKIDGIMGLGFFVDIPQKNAALKLWGTWVKFGGSF
jgi:hypothetical protein